MSTKYKKYTKLIVKKCHYSYIIHISTTITDSSVGLQYITTDDNSYNTQQLQLQYISTPYWFDFFNIHLSFRNVYIKAVDTCTYGMRYLGKCHAEDPMYQLDMTCILTGKDCAIHSQISRVTKGTYFISLQFVIVGLQ